MKHRMPIFLLAVALLSLASCAEPTVPGASKVNERIGVYDSRAITIAYVGSSMFKKRMSDLMSRLKEAEAAGDEEQVKALNAMGADMQRRFYMQGFSTAPVHEYLELVKDRLSQIKKDANVVALVSRWDTDTLARYPAAEHVDVTMTLVDAFEPDGMTLQGAIEIQDKEPIPLEEARKLDIEG